MSNESAAQRAAETLHEADYDSMGRGVTTEESTKIIEAESAVERAQWEAERKQLRDALIRIRIAGNAGFTYQERCADMLQIVIAALATPDTTSEARE